jgi:hypothetical protein
MGTDIHGVFQKRTSDGWVDIPSKYDEERHYQLFAVLADVRNGFGFAGIKTGEPVVPVSEPRGYPADFVVDDDEHPVASLELLGRRAEYYEESQPLTMFMGDHSHSWLTGAEMLAWAESAPEVLKTGILSRSAYEAWDGKTAPDSYCGGISGPSVIVVNDNAVEMEAQPCWTHVRCHWNTCLKAGLAYFFDEVARLVGEHGEVRFVFGFDS